jgi:hypothetical protein
LAFTSVLYAGHMGKGIFGKMGLAAVILLAPGGFLLGAALAADHMRKRRR